MEDNYGLNAMSSIKQRDGELDPGYSGQRDGRDSSANNIFGDDQPSGNSRSTFKELMQRGSSDFTASGTGKILRKSKRKKNAATSI